MIRIQCTGFTLCEGAAVFQLWGSMDGSTYAPVLIQRIGASADSLGQLKKSSKIDTLQIVLQGSSGPSGAAGSVAQSIASPGAWFKFESSDLGLPVSLKYYAVKVFNRLWGSGSGTITYTLEGSGRNY